MATCLKMDSLHCVNKRENHSLRFIHDIFNTHSLYTFKNVAFKHVVIKEQLDCFFFKEEVENFHWTIEKI